MIVSQGYKLSFAILNDHSRLGRNNEKFFWVYLRLPTHQPTLIIVRQKVCYLDFKENLQKVDKVPRIFDFV